VTVGSTESIDSLLAFGCNVSVEQGGTVRGDIADFGGNISLAGTVGGNILALGGNVSLSESAVVNGNISMMGGSVQRAAGSTVTGGVTNNTGNFAPPIPPVPPVAPSPGRFSPFANGFNILGGFITALAFAALGALVVIFAPDATKRVGNTVESKPFYSAGVGCLTFLLVPTLSILLIFTLIGIPVSAILVLVLTLAGLFGWIAIGYLAGEKILQALKARDILPVVAVVVGILILGLLTAIPFLGALVWVVVATLGLGAVVLTRFGTRAYPGSPNMMMTPAVAAAGPSVAGTYTPGPRDIATWEDKARQVQVQETPPAPTEPKTIDIPPSGTDEPIPGA
jgi:hypothetical protein